MLPGATLVVGHQDTLANDALTKVLRQVTWELRDRRGDKLDPEWVNQ
ncbi:hypothetical protein MUBE_06120 [Mycobacterium uberis]|uniref:Uncharacterized protein n=1 Tax=Mycobacterium uberis TaxID=2162698 RepID=A0A3E1HHV2_9MYCO|nr:hypothetical protein [Mycobacterium uberis]RFD24327.1 hypothetical protein MUBE_13735 [Mycobacterium uberis]RFD26031.1 hypothetical protein MUBE_06120 [Mycobacterium uberis]